MLPAALLLPSHVARRFHRRAVLLDTPVADVGSALAYLGYIQIDPINICGRIHDHILRNRVVGYAEGGLMRHLHGATEPLPAAERTAFEHHLPGSEVLVAFPLEAWPFLRTAMKARTRRHGAWSGKLTGRERELAERILAEMAERGPLSSEDINDDRRAWRSVWGSHSLAKSTLQKLFFHGRVLIARRANQRRLYDLPERVLPAPILAAPEVGRAEIERWVVLAKLRQRRLVTLQRDELARVEDRVQPVTVEACPPLYCLREDVPQLEAVLAGAGRPATGEPLLLAPLDPLVYDRRVTRQLWDFAYTWEVYTPARKRVRGYYALPVLAGTELVGHVDAKADRPARKLRVVSRKVRRGHKVAPAVKALARFLGLRG